MKPREQVEDWFPIIHRYLLLLGGLLGITYETVVDHVDRPTLLAVFGGMMGLAEVIHHWVGRDYTKANEKSEEPSAKDAK